MPHENCGITDNPAYETYTGELGVDRLEHDYNMIITWTTTHST